MIINFKNYEEVLGNNSVKLAKVAERVSRDMGIKIIVAPPIPMLSLVANTVDIPVFSQSVEEGEVGRSTGAIVAESIKMAGAKGTLLNHSEARVEIRDIRKLVPKLRSLSLEICLCSRESSELIKLAGLEPEYLAIEPPELIGTGKAVSRFKPQLLTKTLQLTRKLGYSGNVLCGAGIVSGEDVERAIELGMDGVLVSSGIVKSKNWEEKVREMAAPLAREIRK